MITSITYEQKVYIKRQTSSGLGLESFRVSEMTGRKLDLITVIPEHVWNKHGSPYFTSYQVPAKDLIDEQEMQRLLETVPLHQAMTTTIVIALKPPPTIIERTPRWHELPGRWMMEIWKRLRPSRNK